MLVLIPDFKYKITLNLLDDCPTLESVYKLTRKRDVCKLIKKLVTVSFY